MGKKSNKETEPDLEQNLMREYAHWEALKEFGGVDPFYDDATNMNLTRNHIVSIKRQMEEKYGKDMKKYPDIYFRELPPETAKGYVARADEIRDIARKVIGQYLENSDFQYLLCNRELLNKKEADSICIDNVLGYVSGLSLALKQGDLITMRRHAYGAVSYQDSFRSCADKLKRLLQEKRELPDTEKEEQINLFQMGLEVGRCR